VRHNLRLIAHTWGRHRSSLSPGDEGTADAFQEAALSLVKAAEKFDPARGYRFSTYASFWVRRGFWQYASRQRRMIRLPHDKADLLQRAQRLLQEQQAATGRTPSLAWLAQRCGNRGAADGGDPQRALLPLLLQRLDPVSRRLLWHRYLREHPLTRQQIEKVMGLEPAEQERLENEALALLRQAAREFGAL
jgi:RNA polymerase sigma factor (sigma-70 family)